MECGNGDVRITEIENLSINIQVDTDVEKHLIELGLVGFKSGMNIKVFESMSIQDWKNMDTKSEIKMFFDTVYNLISK